MTTLIVDDNAANRKLLRAILEAEGHGTLEAADGVEALGVLEREKVDAIISDILMPRMDGYQFCYEVRVSDRFQHLPFIFLTSSYTSESDKKLGLEIGADRFLISLDPASEIIKALDEAMAGQRSRVTPTEPPGEMSVKKEYNQQLVVEMEQKNIELTAANEELLRSKQQLLLQGTALDTAANAVVITDVKGIILWVNPAFTALTGYAAEEVLGKTPRLLKSGRHDQEFYKHLWATILTGKTWRGNFTNRCKDGSLYHDEHTITPVRSREGTITHFIAIMNDVTERLKAEEALKLFRTLVDRSNDAIEVVDAETGRFLDVNETACKRLGYSREEMLSLFLSDIIAAGNNSYTMQAVLEETRKLGSRIVESRHRRKDGSTFPVEVNVQYIDLNRGYLVAVVRDITERKQAEEQIRAQAALLDKAREAIIVREIEGKFLYWNKGAERIYGWTSEEVVGRSVLEILHTDPQKFREANELTIRQGEWHGELQHLTKDQREITSDVRCTLVRDNEGHPHSILSITTDITERKKIEAQFMRAQRMESIGTLAGGIAHDLNNILSPIMMSIDVLKTLSADPQTRNILDTIEISARRGSDIVRQVLSFARGLEGQRIEVQPKHLLKDLENIIKDTFPKDIRLQFSIPHDTWTIFGDPTQVHLILLNLCVNARDAMPNGGTLNISVENCVLDEQYVGMSVEARAGRYVNISVTDSGAGIPPGLLDKIFEPFFTTKELSKGTGLGLSTVMGIVKSHEGIINVYSEPGRGTTFKVYLPAMEISSEGLNEQEEEASLPRGNGETVLVVDDEVSILSITSQTLQAFGYRVLTAMDGAEAVGIYAEHKGEIAVVLTDMKMPFMDGPATIRALMRINPAIKIIAASGLNAGEDMLKVSGVSLKHSLTKPYTAGTLLRTMRTILDDA